MSITVEPPLYPKDHLPGEKTIVFSQEIVSSQILAEEKERQKTTHTACCGYTIDRYEIEFSCPDQICPEDHNGVAGNGGENIFNKGIDEK
jgi:hypothetical protein